jgi:hypothetical protein
VMKEARLPRSFILNILSDTSMGGSADAPAAMLPAGAWCMCMHGVQQVQGRMQVQGGVQQQPAAAKSLSKSRWRRAGGPRRAAGGRRPPPRLAAAAREQPRPAPARTMVYRTQSTVCIAAVAIVAAAVGEGSLVVPAVSGETPGAPSTLPPSQHCSLHRLVGNWTGSILGDPARSGVRTRMEVKVRDAWSLYLFPPSIGSYHRSAPDPLRAGVATLMPNGSLAVWCPAAANASVSGSWCLVVHGSRSGPTTVITNRSMVVGSWAGGNNCSLLLLRNAPGSVGIAGSQTKWCNHATASSCPKPPGV